MSESNDKSGSRLQQTQIFNEHLNQLKEGLDDLSHSYQFFLNAVEALTNPDNNQTDAKDWHLGMWLTGRWIHRQCQAQLDLALDIEAMRWQKYEGEGN